MAIEDFLSGAKINIDKYGFFFWFIMFGFIDVIFSLIHAPDYIPLGLLFCAFGLLGYSLSELMDRISYSCFKKQSDEQGDKKVWVVKIPLWFHLLNVLFKLCIFLGLFILINYKYKYF